MNKKLLYFVSDYSIGLSALMTDQAISINATKTPFFGVGGENDQEPGLTQLLANNNVIMERIQGLDVHKDFWRLVKQIKSIIIRENIEIVHVQNNWQLAIVGIVKTLLRIKHPFEVIYTVHGFRHNSRWKAPIAQAAIGTGLFLFSDHIICMTDYVKSKFGLLSYKIKKLPLGIKDNFFIEEFSEPKLDGLHLIFPAQFRHGKNQDLILRSFKTFIEQTGDTSSTLTLPGNGPMLDNIKTLAIDLDIADRVIFPGFVTKDQILKMYLESNVAIVASNSETFGQSIVEPYVLGRCVISTPVGIAPEIIKNDENGFIFKSEASLTHTLLYISKNIDCLAKIGRNNFEKRDIYRWSEITRQYIEKLLKR